jgi:hypothetical protein
MERGGHVPCGVTAHGSPSGPLQFERLEAALAAKFHRSQKVDSMAKYKNSTLDGVTTELAKPRMAKSARIAELNLHTAHIPEQPSITVPGTVNKIIASPRPSQPEKAEIAVDGDDSRNRALRIENKLTDEHGDDVSLKKGAHVDVIVTAKEREVGYGLSLEGASAADLVKSMRAQNEPVAPKGKVA